MPAPLSPPTPRSEFRSRHKQRAATRRTHQGETLRPGRRRRTCSKRGEYPAAGRTCQAALAGGV
jgi:hypothetical protein